MDGCSDANLKKNFPQSTAGLQKVHLMHWFSPYCLHVLNKTHSCSGNYKTKIKLRGKCRQTLLSLKIECLTSTWVALDDIAESFQCHFNLGQTLRLVSAGTGRALLLHHHQGVQVLDENTKTHPAQTQGRYFNTHSMCGSPGLEIIHVCKKKRGK